MGWCYSKTMKILDRFRVLAGKQPKVKPGQRFRYLNDGVTKDPIEEPKED